MTINAPTPAAASPIQSWLSARWNGCPATWSSARWMARSTSLTGSRAMVQTGDSTSCLMSWIEV
jgi:hypothetical protein